MISVFLAPFLTFSPSLSLSKIIVQVSQEGTFMQPKVAESFNVPSRLKAAIPLNMRSIPWVNAFYNTNIFFA